MWTTNLSAWWRESWLHAICGVGLCRVEWSIVITFTLLMDEFLQAFKKNWSLMVGGHMYHKYVIYMYFVYVASCNWHLSIFGQTASPKIIRDNNNNFECLYSMFTNHYICVIPRSNVHHTNDWKCPKFMYTSNLT